jgi:hypothetical protein
LHAIDEPVTYAPARTATGLRLSAAETARLDEASTPIVDDYPYGDLGVSQRDRRPPASHLSASRIVGFLLFPPNWWETAADMPIQLALLQGGSSAFRPGPIAP